MTARAKRQQALIDELHAIATRIDRINGELCAQSLFPARDAFTEGQANSCLIVAHQNLEVVVDLIANCGEEGVTDPRTKESRGMHDDLVLPQLERRGKPRGQGGLEANAPAKAGVGRSGVARGVVIGGAR